MNMHVQHGETYLQRLHREHKERQKRLWNNECQKKEAAEQARKERLAKLEEERRREAEAKAKEDAEQQAMAAAIKRMADAFARETRRLEAMERATGGNVIVAPRIAEYPLASLLKFVCDRYEITTLDMRSERRTWNLLQPRFEFSWLGRSLTTRSYPQIGKFLGGKDHTTIMHAVERYTGMQQAALSQTKCTGLLRPDLMILSEEHFRELWSSYKGIKE